MKIAEIIHSGRVSLSFEVFPPREEFDRESIFAAAGRIAELDPSFMSTTYRSAGNDTSANTIELASRLQGQYGVPQLAHLTCIASTREGVKDALARLRAAGIENVLALRGDRPADGVERPSDYRYASELVRDIKGFGGFCIGGACYPESHPEARTKDEDMDHVREKVDAGCEFLTTQMFFDNNILYNYLYRLRERGVRVPVIAGIMPVTNGKQIKRICALSGTYLPERFKAIVDRFGDNPAAMKQAGIAYATEQIVDLIANGVHAIHVYSMNKPEVASRIKQNVSELL